uniref:DNA polymerase epsilon subunit 3 n=1 Tax=Astyanax mexicanus TaxID=7994 RepID=A0A8B9KE19_ASTMX
MAERPEDLNLPNAVITRIIKEALPDGVNVSKEARRAISQAASVFVLYATSCANSFAMKAKRKTLNAGDVMSAMEEMEFERFLPPLRDALEGCTITSSRLIFACFVYQPTRKDRKAKKRHQNRRRKTRRRKTVQKSTTKAERKRRRKKSIWRRRMERTKVRRRMWKIKGYSNLATSLNRLRSLRSLIVMSTF